VWNPAGGHFYEILTFGNKSADAVKDPLSKEIGIFLSQEMVI